MKDNKDYTLPLGPLALILSKHYYGVLSKKLENLDVDRYYSVLEYLSRHNGCPQQQICNALAIDKTAMVKVIGYLLKARYIVRQQNQADRREHFVMLSAKGRRKTLQVVKAFEDIDAAVFKGISRSERTVFLKVVDALQKNLKELPANDLFFNYNKTKKTPRIPTGTAGARNTK